ncbi:MAG: hypothetical protein ABI759_10275 [Candidatus Solibacter sp.]
MIVSTRQAAFARIFAIAATLIAGQSMALGQHRGSNPGSNQMTRAAMPLAVGWFNGLPCLYTSTDASDADVAKAFGANYAPQLTGSADRATRAIYAVTNFSQGNIVPTAPAPQGPTNTDRGYSPLWLVNTVTWNPGATPVVLRSEADVMAMQQAGMVTIMRTNIVVNCSILWTPQGGVLPGSVVSIAAGTKPGSIQAMASMPVTQGWFNGQHVLYLSPEASDAAAGGPDANLSVLLGSAANTNAVDPIYVVTNFKQGNVIPSAPIPTGPQSTARGYTPLWQVNAVTWKQGITPSTLKSEADVMAAAASGNVTVAKTNIVVNCPVIHTPLGGTLAGVTITPAPER